MIVRPALLRRGGVAVAAGLVLCVGAGGCGAGGAWGERGAGTRPAAVALPTDVRGLSLACTPTGIELCFNAVDDNCDGVVDEGCGEPTGTIQILAAWTDAATDVNLDVLLPSGRAVRESDRLVDGFRYARNCPTESCEGQNIESIVFEGADPPRGTYQVRARLEALAPAARGATVHLSARVGATTYGSDVELTPLRDQVVATFTL